MNVGRGLTVIWIGLYMFIQASLVSRSHDVHFAINWLTSSALGVGGALLIWFGVVTVNDSLTSMRFRARKDD